MAAIYLQDLKTVPRLNNVERYALLKINGGQRGHVTPKLRNHLRDIGLIDKKDQLTFRGTAALKAALKREAKDGS